MIKTDPIEKTKEYKKIEKELEEKIVKRIGPNTGQLGYCHKYWAVKKQILLEDYNIDWSSPDDLNRGRILFD